MSTQINTFKEYKQEVQKMFAFYGFIGCPLDSTQLQTLWLIDVPLNTVYGIGCDVSGGYTLNESLQAAGLLGE